MSTNLLHDNLINEYRNYILKTICNTPILVEINNNDGIRYEETYEQSIHLLKKENIDNISHYIHQIFNLEQEIEHRHNTTNVFELNQQFVSQLRDEYKELYLDILNNREQVSKNDIYLGIKKLITDSDKKYKNLFSDICLIWMFDYDMSRSVLNYNLLFLDIYSKYFRNRTYLTNFTPESLHTGSPTEYVQLKPEIFNEIKFYNHNYIYIDDISYSGNQLLEDIRKWKQYIDDNYTELMVRRIKYKYTFKIYLYAITTSALIKYHRLIKELSTKYIIIELNYCKILYTSIPYIFEKYIEYKLQNKSLENCKIKTDIDGYKDYERLKLSNLRFNREQGIINWDILNHKIENTFRIINSINPQHLILFGDFYFVDELNEFCHSICIRFQTFYHIDYKIPDDRSINNRLFYGYVPEYILDRKKMSTKTLYVGRIENLNGPVVFQLKLYDNELIPMDREMIFKSLQLETYLIHIPINKEIQRTLYNKPYIAWYKKYINPSNTS